MKKVFLSIVLAVSFLLLAPGLISAASYVADESSRLKIDGQGRADYRVLRLKNYLRTQDSPLVPYAEDFVRTADKYNLDWRLVPGIAGVESTFGKRIPGGYNAYGWASGTYRFTSWEDSIEVVTKSLREDYIDKGAPTIDKIGRRYCPPSSDSWSWKVKFFMARIDSFPFVFTI